jgi:FtsP/CotA-like multicopper oxidase with cupredoxin domain
MDSIRGGLYGAISIRKRDEAAPDREFVVFLSSHQKLMTINGRAGEVVQWDVLALGDDHHTFHIHGHRWRAPDRTSIDTRTIGPAESISFRIREDAVGTWLYHCHVEGHMMEGMIGIYRVHR